MDICAGEHWKQVLEARITDAASALAALNPLLALLPRPEFRLKAAYGLGLAVPLVAKDNMESARVFMRRLMWSMNEESGNLGWGIPEAMGCILGKSTALAREYGHILVSYGHDTGREDNFVDHAPLRRGVFQGIALFAALNPEAATPALPQLVTSLNDEDAGVRGMASLALFNLVTALSTTAACSTDTPSIWLPAHRALEDALKRMTPENDPEIELLDGTALIRTTLHSLHRQALDIIEKLSYRELKE